MDTTILNQLIEFIKNASPLIWGIYLKQVYVNNFTTLFIGLIFAGAIFPLYKAYNWGKNSIATHEKEEADRFGRSHYITSSAEDFALWGSAITIGIFAIVAIICIISGIVPFLNPEYYAIKLILSALP
jgi:hypothetical protein